MDDSKKRQRLGVLGSCLVHVCLLLLLSLSGLLSLQPNLADDIVEVSLYGGGGGGGNDAGDEDISAEEEAAEAEEQTAEELAEADAIWQQDKNTTPAVAPKPKKVTQKPTTNKKKSPYPYTGGSGTGVGSGHGSGIGPGTGSGSGGGNGSGHGTGNGSGIGPGDGIYGSPAIPPRITYNPQPSYPTAERNAGITGTAVLRLLVAKNGSVEAVDIKSSSGNANLDQAAVNACYRWRFTSAKNATGQNVRCYISVPITFRLK